MRRRRLRVSGRPRTIRATAYSESVLLLGDRDQGRLRLSQGASLKHDESEVTVVS
jgi:hypothetical protein